MLIQRDDHVLLLGQEKLQLWVNMERVRIISTPARRHTLPPGPLKHSHHPLARLVRQRRFIPRSVRVQMDAFQVREDLRQIGEGYPKLANVKLAKQTIPFLDRHPLPGAGQRGPIAVVTTCRAKGRHRHGIP